MPRNPRAAKLRRGTLALVSLLALAPVQAYPAKPSKEAIDAVFAGYDSTEVPGCALGIYEEGEISYARGYGMANLEYGLALTPASAFRLASVSKQFMAAAIALLDEAGELDLDDDVRKYFPDLPDYGTTLTLRHLIFHTSGIRDYLDLAWLADWGEWYLPQEALRLIERQQALNFEPGSEYLYSNSGYLMLADIVEQVTGQTLREWSDENLFGPLGMTNTHFHDDHRRIVPRRATGYAPTDEGWEISMSPLDMVGDGGIVSTVADLERWHENFDDNRLGKGRSRLIELMETPAELTSGESTDYGFGLVINDFQGTREVEHSGSWVGYRTALHRFPEIGLGIAVLCNRADADPTTLAREVAALYLAAGDGAPATAAAETRSGDNGATATPERGVELNEAQLQRHVGSYWQEADLARRLIVLEDGMLHYDRDGWGRSPLVPLDENTFLMGDVATRVLVAFRDGTMAVNADGDEPWVLERFEAVMPDPDALAAFTGTFYSEELDHFQHLSVNASTLVADRRGGPATLEALPGERFITDGVVFEFDRDADGAVSGFRVNSGRVRNVAYARRVGADG